MMASRATRVDRLVRWAVAGRRPDGSPTIRARWAVWRLVRSARPAGRLVRRLAHWRDQSRPSLYASHRVKGHIGRLASPVERGRRYAGEGLWRGWLAEPGNDLLWEALGRVWSEDEVRRRVLAAASEPDRSAPSRVAIGAACIARGVLPVDPRDRALFLMVTGQVDQQRALDPEGTLLAAAYGACDEPGRATVRRAMVEAGDLDVVRIVAGRERRERRQDLTEGEARYLAWWLAERHDWPGLWRLALELPVRLAVEAVGLVDAWSPSGYRDRALFEAMRELNHAAWESAMEELSAAALVAIPLDELAVNPTDRLRVDCGRFSRDGSQVVVSVSRREDREAGGGLADYVFRESVLASFDSFTGELLGRMHFEGERFKQLLEVDDGLVTAGYSTEGDGGLVLTRRPPEAKPVKIYLAERYIDPYHRWGDEIMACDREQGILRFGLDGSALGAIPFADLGVPAPTVSLLATHGPTGRVAMAWSVFGLRFGIRSCVRAGLVLLGPKLEPLAHAPVPTERFAVYGGFDGPDRLVTVGGHSRGMLAAWNAEDGHLTCTGEGEFPFGLHYLGADKAVTVILPWQRRVLWQTHNDRLRVVDADTLTEVAFRPEELCGLFERHRYCDCLVDCLWQADDGSLIGSATRAYGQPVVRVSDPALHYVRDGWLERSLGALRLEDWVVLARARERLEATGRPAGSALLRLLDGCLEYRFGDGIALGKAWRSTADSTDIGIARHEPMNDS